MASPAVGEREEEDTEGRTCGLVDVVISVMYRSTLLMNFGIWSWWKVENKTSSISRWMVCRVLQQHLILVGEEARLRRVFSHWF